MSGSGESAPKLTGFFSLPIETRSDIYKRVLALPQSLYLFQDPGCPIETFAPGKPYRWLALLYVNRQISAEACTFYTAGIISSSRKWKHQQQQRKGQAC